jgi:hypothetical protein
MRAFSAAQALSPAVERTKDLLFRPFRWATFLKLCAVALFTEGSSGNFNSLRHGARTETGASFEPGSLGFSLEPWHILIIVGIVVTLLVIGLAIFYLQTRLRFALFDCLIHQTTLIAPGWRKYRSQALRFFGLSIMIGIIFSLVSAILLFPFLLKFWHIYHESQLDNQFPASEILSWLMPLLPVILLIAVAAIALDIVLRDFMLPHFAIEDASAGQAWDAAWTRISREKGSFLFYAVLRVVVPIVVTVGIVIVLAIPCLIVFGVLGSCLSALHSYLDQTTALNMAIGSLIETALILFVAALALIALISFFGPVSIAVRNYALLFYGGRYQALGDILSPPTAAPTTQQNIP